MMMKRQSGLGRGLGALIPQKQNEAKTHDDIVAGVFNENVDSIPNAADFSIEDRVVKIPVESIIPNSKQPRLFFDGEGIEELTASIKEHGILQPLIVIDLGEGKYELIAGERRLRAAKNAGLTTVPALVRKASEQEKLELAIIENVQRRDLNAIEEARAYAQLRDEFDLTQEQISVKVGKSRPQVANIMRLLELEQDIQHAVAEGRITQSHARTLLGIPDRDERMKIFEQMLNGNFTVRQSEAKIPASNKRPKIIDPNILELEAKLRAYFGGRVAVKRKPDGDGEIKIEFGSDEDLQRILDKIATTL
jgi:ParB family chromosome partitioning protein